MVLGDHGDGDLDDKVAINRHTAWENQNQRNHRVVGSGALVDERSVGNCWKQFDQST